MRSAAMKQSQRYLTTPLRLTIAVGALGLGADARAFSTDVISESPRSSRP